MDKPELNSVDVEAVSAALDALNGAGINVEQVSDIDRTGDDGRVRFELTCEADTRTTSLNDFES